MKQILDPGGHLTRTRSYAYDAVNRLAGGSENECSLDPIIRFSALSLAISGSSGAADPIGLS